MSSSSHELKAKIELLKSLGGRVRPASEMLHGAEPALPRTPVPRKSPRLHEISPSAERVEIAGGTCTVLTTSTELTGRRSAEGYLCPVAPFVPDLAGGAFLESLAMLARDPAWAGLDPAGIVFLDTETTSLNAASGTYAFLVGLGRLRGGRMEVRQFLMDDLHEEEAVLAAVERDLEGACALVTYNGRTFDLPLLQTRWRMHRRRPGFPGMHLDLLHPARRLWRGRLPDCRLATLEREILGVIRFSDAPSAMIPAIYFDYLKGRRPERMLAVADHHAQDILSLAAVAAAMSRVLARDDDPRFDHAADHWGASGILERAGFGAASLARLERAALVARDETLGFRLAMHLARRLVREGRAGEAADIWRARLPQASPARIDPHVELSRHAERRGRDPASALIHARRALELVESSEAAAHHTARRLAALRAECRRRVERLASKTRGRA